jgi:hypothetical protein
MEIPKLVVMPGDLEKLESRVKDLTNRFDMFMESEDKRVEAQNEMDIDMKLLLLLLKGNEMNPEDKGVVGTINELKREVASLKRFKDKTVYLLIGFSFGAGWAISDFISKFLAK